MTDAPDMEPAALEAAANSFIQKFHALPAGSDTYLTRIKEAMEPAIRAYLAARSAPEAGKAVDWREAMQLAIDYLKETKHGSPSRSAGHNARLVLEAALASSPAPTGAGPVAWMVLRKGNLHLPVLTSKEDAVRYQQYNPEETLQPLYASPQAVLAEDVAGQPVGFAYRDAQWMDEGRWHLCKTEPNAIKGRKVETVFLGSFVGSLAARLEASEAETTSLLHRLDMLQVDFNDCNSVRASLRRKLEEHRKMLAEAREHINRYADTAAEHDLVARIDALEDKP